MRSKPVAGDGYVVIDCYIAQYDVDDYFEANLLFYTSVILGSDFSK